VFLQLERGLDLVHLELDDRIVLVVVVRVVASEDSLSLIYLALGDQPSRRLRNEPAERERSKARSDQEDAREKRELLLLDSPDESDLNDGGKSLENGRNPPRPVVLNPERSKGRPGRDDVTRVPK